MKYSFKYIEELDENEIIIEHNASDEMIDQLHLFLRQRQKAYASLKLFKQEEQFFVPVENIIFFETEDNNVYAHTNNDSYLCEYKLYELIEKLPNHFLRISKSTICNTTQVLSISRYLSSTGTITFSNSPKTIYVSRKFFPELKEALEKRNTL